MKSSLMLVAATGTLLLTSACGHTDAPPPPQQTGSLTHNLNMVDHDGRIYGHVELDPVGGGKVFDSNGRLIGDVVPPER